MMRVADTNHPPRILKICGADAELGNFVVGSPGDHYTGRDASRAVLAAVRGLPRRELLRYSSSSTNWQAAVYGGQRHQRQYECVSESTADPPQDWGRKFLPENGGCVYIDLDHVELCTPEVANAWDYVAAWHAMLRIAREALQTANQERSPNRKIQVLVNNSDGLGNSYGSHLNFLITRLAWKNIFNRKLHQLQYLASFQASSIVYTGQGKVGAENGAPDAVFQLSQRADFFEKVLSLPTTFNRGIVNSRDEALCGSSGNSAEPGAPARLHSIFFDNTLAHGSSLLKVGAMQIVLAMIEAGYANPDLILEDPVDAVVRISHDPTMRTCATLASGRQLTAVELQMSFLEDARAFAAAEGFDDVVPRANDILDLWEDTLAKLQAGDFQALAPRLDWVMKLTALERALDQHADLDWLSPEIKLLDHLYSSLDDDGLYWAFENSGLVERLVSDEHIGRLTQSPPEDTRAWTRAMLLRRAGASSIDSVDWDSIGFKLRGKTYWPTYRKVDLADPLAFTRATMEPVFQREDGLEEILDAVDLGPDSSGRVRIDAAASAHGCNNSAN